MESVQNNNNSHTFLEKNVLGSLTTQSGFLLGSVSQKPFRSSFRMPNPGYPTAAKSYRKMNRAKCQ